MELVSLRRLRLGWLVRHEIDIVRGTSEYCTGPIGSVSIAGRAHSASGTGARWRMAFKALAQEQNGTSAGTRNGIAFRLESRMRGLLCRTKKSMFVSH